LIEEALTELPEKRSLIPRDSADFSGAIRSDVHLQSFVSRVRLLLDSEFSSETHLMLIYERTRGKMQDVDGGKIIESRQVARVYVPLREI
jgi:hypothetical protein